MKISEQGYYEGYERTSQKYKGVNDSQKNITVLNIY